MRAWIEEGRARGCTHVLEIYDTSLSASYSWDVGSIRTKPEYISPDEDIRVEFGHYNRGGWRGMRVYDIHPLGPETDIDRQLRARSRVGRAAAVGPRCCAPVTTTWNKDCHYRRTPGHSLCGKHLSVYSKRGTAEPPYTSEMRAADAAAASLKSKRKPSSKWGRVASAFVKKYGVYEEKHFGDTERTEQYLLQSLTRALEKAFEAGQASTVSQPGLATHPR